MSPPPPPPPSVDDSSNSLSHIIRTTLSYDTNVMLAAVISLLLVILFVLLLHLYTRWFLLHARRRRTTSATVPNALLRSTIHHHHHRFTVIDATTNNPSNSPNKLGLPFAIISSLPLFVHKKSEQDKHYASDCAICLSVFEDEEIGRKLPDCGHAFHVECIDMWLQSHSTCPICRGAIRCIPNRKIDHLEIEINDPDQELNVSSSNEEVLRLEIINITSISSNQINQISEPAAIENDDSGLDASSSIGESIKKLLSSNGGCSCSSSRSGGKIHPSSNVNGDELSNA